MAKLCKKSIFIVLLAICLATCLVLVACNDDPPAAQTVTYTVTVNTGANAPAEGVKVTVKQGTTAFEFKTTDATGKVTFELAEGEYDAVLSDLPAHYTVPADATLKLTKENPNLAVTLEKEFSYTVKLVNAADNSVFYAPGVQVGVCTLTGNCLEPVALEQNGTVSIYVAKSDYHVQILGLPSTYVYECDEQGYYTGKNFSSTEVEMTIKIYEATPILSATAMTDAEKTEYTAANPYYPASAHKNTSYAFTKTLEAKQTANFTITPALSGTYSIYCGENNNNLKFLSQSTSFLPTGGQMIYTNIVLEEGKTYYINVENSTDEQLTAKFVVTAPAASYVKLDGIGSTLNLSVNSLNANAIVSFTPTKAGKYTAAVQGETLTYVSLRNKEFSSTPVEDSLYVKNAACSTKLTPDMLGSTIYFSVSIKAEQYPATATLKITLDTEITNTTNVMAASGTIEKFNFNDDTKELTPVEMSSSVNLVKGNDGYYHLGAADGPVVVVILTAPVDESRYAESASIAYFEMANIPAKYVFDATSHQDKANLEKGNTYNDYRLLIRGFNDYDSKPGMWGPELSIPTTLVNSNCYAANVNQDGAYPLTQELYDFLQAFGATNNQILSFNVDSTCEPGCEWMYPLYYYGDKVDADEIVGDYKFVSTLAGGNTYNIGDTYTDYSMLFSNSLTDNKFTADTVMIRVYKNNTFKVCSYDAWSDDGYDFNGPYDSGTWENNNGVYTFTCEYGRLTYADGVLTYTDIDMDGTTELAIVTLQMVAA